MIPGFVVELLHTDLDDFVEHINLGVREFCEWYAPDAPIGDTKILWTERTHGPGSYYPDDILIAGNVAFLGIWINISCSQNRRTVRWWEAHFNSDNAADHLYFEAMFELIAIRYRRDQLHVVFIDQGGSQSRADKVLEWLKFHWGDAVQPARQLGEQERKEIATLSSNNRPSSYGDKCARSTLVHHLVTKYHQKPDVACGLVQNITQKTYNDHLEKNLLLTDSEFAKEWQEWRGNNKTLDDEARWVMGTQR